jgi:hypothetical protein
VSFVPICILALAVAAAAQVEQPASPPNAPSATQKSGPNSPLTFGGRVAEYQKSVINLGTLVLPAMGAGIAQASNRPPEWEQGAAGYGRRYGSLIGERVISETIRFGFAAADREDSRYFLSEDRSTWGRTRHAVASTLVSRTASGRRIPAFSQFAGNYGAAFIANSWYPDSESDTYHALERGSIGVAVDAGFNLLREFAPRLMRPFGKR